MSHALQRIDETREALVDALANVTGTLSANWIWDAVR